MNDTFVQALIRRLNITDEAGKLNIRALYETWEESAHAICNRDDTPSAMASILDDTVASAYNRIGDEGAVSSSVGGQNISYEDLYKRFEERLISAHLRRLRL
jgi:hypothetical protein